MYTLVDAQYKAGGMKILMLDETDITGEIPRNTFVSKEGIFMAKDGFVEAEILLTFEDSTGRRQTYNAYRQIKNCLPARKRITEKRRKEIVAKVAVIAQTSSKYAPSEWVKQAVSQLKV